MHGVLCSKEKQKVPLSTTLVELNRSILSSLGTIQGTSISDEVENKVGIIEELA